ncbi:MAG: hypothetical protein HOH89_01275 [Alphaproteobacteria bacterium]|nr:hypothetical protein [Alphaproteobacteria bacterium]
MRFFIPALAKRLKEDYGSEIHVYCNTPEQQKGYEKLNVDGLFTSITTVDFLFPDTWPTDLDEAAVIDRARVFEERFGLTLNHLLVSDRHLGRGYALGGFYHPRSRQTEGMDYINVVHAFNETLGFWDNEFATKEFTLILQGGRNEGVVAREYGVAMRNIEPARYQRRFLWAVDEFESIPTAAKAYHAMEDGSGAPVLEKPTEGHLAARKRALASTSLMNTAGKIGYLIARNLYWRIRRYKNAKGYYLGDFIAYRLRFRRDMREMTRLPGLEVLAGKQFVFYPLNTEPERALQGLSPEYLSQLSCITSISRDLPAGVMLVVKEHSVAIGRRPADFYKQISEFKNVVMVNVTELGMEIVRKASAVVMITGSVGFEAAVIGKPVITFGQHCGYSFLPHVRTVTSESQLSGYLKDALLGDFDAERARIDGARFLKAIVQVSSNLAKDFERDPSGFDSEMVDVAYAGLMETFDSTTNLAPPKSAPVIEQA